MERHTFLKVLGLTLIALFIGIVVIPGSPPDAGKNLPWQVEQLAGGSSRVFGISLGETPVIELQKRLREQSEVTLFAMPDGSKSLEVYFDRSSFSGLAAKLVLTVALSEEQLEGVFERGVRISTQGDGSRKVTLSHDDLVLVQNSAIDSITYLPKIRLERELVTARFGEPDEVITDPKGEVEHWLYPKLGLDLTLDPKGKAVLQYVMPKKFDDLRGPLIASLNEASEK